MDFLYLLLFLVILCLFIIALILTGIGVYKYLKREEASVRFLYRATLVFSMAFVSLVLLINTGIWISVFLISFYFLLVLLVYFIFMFRKNKNNLKKLLRLTLTTFIITIISFVFAIVFSQDAGDRKVSFDNEGARISQEIEVATEREEKAQTEAKKKEEEAKAKEVAEAKKKEEEAKAKEVAEAKKKEEEAKAKEVAEAKKKEEEAKAKEVAEAKKKEEEAKAKEVAEAKKKEEKAKATTKKKEQENKDFVFQKEISLHLLDLTDSINIFQELHTKIDNRYSLLKGEQVKEIFDEKFQEFIVLYTLHNMEEVQRHIPDDLEAMDLYDEATELGVQGIEELSAAISTGDSEMYLKAGKTFEKYKIAKMAAYEKLVDHIEN